MPDSNSNAEGQSKPTAVPESTPPPEAAGAGAGAGAASSPSAPKPPSLFSLVKAGEEQPIRDLVASEIKSIAAKHHLTGYEIIFLFDNLDPITDFHSDRIYSVLSVISKINNILLVVQSRGGKIEPAFLISKTCKKLAKSKFVVAVPRKAKSAATLLALGADEIHMGLMSQLGPIDPQINDLPALGLANGLTRISKLVCDYPKSGEMWAKYLIGNLSLWQLGHFERLSESATQYAERLLQGKTLPPGQTAKTLGDHFVNHYKDHSFLIDIGEATALLGDETVKVNTPEYSFANDVYQLFDMLEFLLRYFWKKEFYFVGDTTPDSLSIRIKQDA